MALKIPLFYYPTTIGLVDNDDDFTESLKRSLGATSGYSLIETFDTAQKVLSFASQKKRRNHLLENVISPLDEDVTERYKATFNLRALFQAIYDENRYLELSTLIVDYDMPDMNGLELFEKIDTPGLQKILLTGVADESIAIDAFNQGRIQGYIKKHDFHMVEKVNEALKGAFKRYFLDLGRAFEAYSDAEDLQKSPLTHGEFQTYFENMLQTHKIQEYYLLQMTGSFLLVDSSQSLKGLYTYGDDFIEVLLESGESEHASQTTLKEIEKGKKILCYYDPHSTPVPSGNMWPKYLRPATCLSTSSGSFYTTVSDLLFHLDKENIKLKADKPSPDLF